MRRPSLFLLFLLGLSMTTHAASPADTAEALVERANEHRIAAWLSVAQLDRNPYLWAGQRVALVVRLQRMIDPRNALVQQPGQKDGPAIVLGDVTPETFRRETVVVIAKVDPERVPLHGSEQPYSAATFVTALPCNADACDDLLASDIPWGKPLQP